MRRALIIFVAVCGALLGRVRAAEVELVAVNKIWDRGGHNAFTDLQRWHGQWWCVFRESAGHVGGDGVIRLIVSKDGETWESAAALTERDVDLRDPKLSVTPDDRLMIVCGGSIYLGTRVLKGRQPRVAFSTDGKKWTEPRRVLEEGDWLWRITWHEGVAYGVSYRSAPAADGKPATGDGVLLLFRSRDGVAWETVSQLAVPNRPNETTLRFRRDGTMLAMVRREDGDKVGWFGEAKPPYSHWTWHPSNLRLGGPDFIELPDGRWIAGTRLYDKKTGGPAEKIGTAIANIDGKFQLTPLLTLPSGGDTSYPGFVWHEGLLWMSYYSSHEGKTSIYLAKIRL
jgi:hypothetical protein